MTETILYSIAFSILLGSLIWNVAFWGAELICKLDDWLWARSFKRYCRKLDTMFKKGEL